MTTASFETFAAEQLLEASVELTDAWAARVAERRSDRRGGTHALQLAGHMPDVLRSIAGFVLNDDADVLRHDTRVTEALATLVRLRRAEGSAPAVLIQELDILAQVLDAACLDWIRGYPSGPPTPDSVVRVAGRLNRAPIVLGELGIATFWQEEHADRRDASVQLRAFADRLSHELKTPLNAAVMTAQLLEYTDGALRSPEAKRLVTLIRRNLDRADRVLQDVRSASLATQGPAGAPVRPFGQVLGEVLAQVHEELVGSGVRLDVEEPVASVRVDAARVKLILVNLIRNAIRYSDPARSSRWIRVVCVRIAAEDRWWVHVSDNGVGIPAEHQDSIFRRSFRAHPEQSHGTGLGLMIVRQEVEAQGGRIDFSSQPGVGTTFRFSLEPAGEE